jgi:NADH:ubiquinone oxidoreductase subunit 5 (subunit L)/multisubunit Na+/H+ antiporter MnhA subunit
MKNEFLLLTIIFTPLLGAFILPFIGGFSRSLRNWLALALVSVSFLASARLIPVVISGEVITISRAFPLGLDLVFTADSLAVFMAVVSSFISAIIVLYSFGYISHYKNQNEYYLMVVLFLGAMMGLVFSGNLIYLYLFWEITAIACWRLIGFFREKTHVLKADKAFLVTVFGALVMLVGFFMVYQQAGSFDLAIIKANLKNNPVTNLAVILILCGIFSKSATLPFHTWLADAGVAPSPVTALLHAAVLVKIGIYVFARLFLATFTFDPIWHTIIPIIAGSSALISAGVAFIETDIKRIIAYSTISQIGFIFFGLAIGNELAVGAGLLYILMHGLSKAGLFLCAGIIEQNTKIKDVTKLGGLIKTMPITAVAFLFCALSTMGIPPFGGFFSKYLTFAGAVKTGQTTIILIFLAGAFLTILYLFRLFNLVFLGEPGSSTAKEHSPLMITSVVILAILSLAGGIFVYYPMQLTGITVSQMFGVLR